MNKTQTITDFYKEKFNWMPDNLKKEIGHFNVFPLSDYVGPNAKTAPYSRKDFYKISIISGHMRYHYADKSIEIEKTALVFSNPQIPYTWEPLSVERTGFFCIFTEAFFDHYGQIREYPIFKPGGMPIFLLSDEQVEATNAVFKKMCDEIASDYVYKYDVLRNLVLELVHSALKMQPASGSRYTASNAAIRVSSVFSELLERQFPIESPRQRVQLRSPAEFAGQLSVHVNHLNRSLKEITGKTTSQLIAERVAQEARTLLRHTEWNISEIGWCLGFEELPHFIHFFRKNAAVTPNSFRKMQDV